MKRNDMLKIVNPVLAVLLLSQLLSALLSDVVPKEVFEIWHEGGGVCLAIIAGLHLILNWGWVKTSFLKSRPTDKS